MMMKSLVWVPAYLPQQRAPRFLRLATDTSYSIPTKLPACDFNVGFPGQGAEGTG